MNFTVLISVYKGNTVVEITECLGSLETQTQEPDEIILVIDGPVDAKIQSVLHEFVKKLPLKIVKNNSNMGLAAALNIGLNHCTNDYIFRMDIDDVCAPNRFELQLDYLKSNPNVDILGGQIMKFQTYGNWQPARKLPCNSSRIRSYMKFRNPLNHPTVLFRKSKILSLGGYPEARFSQDYLLWINALKHDFRVENLEDVLVYMRVDKKLFSRRGIQNCHYDLKPYEMMRYYRMTNVFEYFVGLLLRRAYCVYSTILSFIIK